MGEKRLVEITSTIKGMDSPLGAIGYVSTLSDSDIYLLLKYLSNSKYQGMTFADALFAFSNNYLASKDLLIEEQESSLDEFHEIEVVSLGSLLSEKEQSFAGSKSRR